MNVADLQNSLIHTATTWRALPTDRAKRGAEEARTHVIQSSTTWTPALTAIALTKPAEEEYASRFQVREQTNVSPTIRVGIANAREMGPATLLLARDNPHVLLIGIAGLTGSAVGFTRVR